VQNFIKQTFSTQIICFLFLWIISSSLVGASSPANYPVPPESDRSLFYLQRSSNANTVIYDANLLPNGQLNSRQPVEVYWLRYNTDGHRRALNFVERNFAYGLKFNSVGSGAYAIELMAYSGRDITVLINKEGRPVAQTIIKGQPVYLKSIYIDVSGSGFWSTVNYIELVGKELKEGKLIRERFDPNKDDD
jgi:hypothetical protein